MDAEMAGEKLAWNQWSGGKQGSVAAAARGQPDTPGELAVVARTFG